MSINEADLILGFISISNKLSGMILNSNRTFWVGFLLGYWVPLHPLINLKSTIYSIDIMFNLNLSNEMLIWVIFFC